MIAMYGSGTKRRWIGFIGVAAALAGSISACGMFEIRPPVAPKRTVVVPREDPISPDAVLHNFEWAVAFKEDGLAQYAEALDDGFVLRLDPVDIAELSNQFTQFNKTEDEDLQRRFVQSTPDSLYFDFEDDWLVQQTGATAFYEDIPYTLQFLRGPTNEVVGTVQGTIKLTLLRNDQTETWAMLEWIDQKAEGQIKSFGRQHAEPETVPE